MILLPKVPDIHHVILEIKYIRKGFGYGWLRESLMKTVTGAELYARTFKTKAWPALLIVLAGDEGRGNIDRRVREARLLLVELGLAGKIAVINETAIHQLPCEKLRDLLLPP